MKIIINKQTGFNVQRNKGFTLIEVLIALIVLSIGLLGAAGLQAKSQQYSRSAYFNTQSTVLAHDLLERMRANPQGLIVEKVYNNPTATKHDSCFTLSGCSVTDMAQNDMYEWRQDALRKLPSGTGVVCIDSTPDDGEPSDVACDNTGTQYVVKVWWKNKDAQMARVVTTVSF